MSKNSPYARIAITLPHNDLAAADRLAAQHDRSRSWIVAEAIRRYAAEAVEAVEAVAFASQLGKSRTLQLRADAALRRASEWLRQTRWRPSAHLPERSLHHAHSIRSTHFSHGARSARECATIAGGASVPFAER